jgi:hypothetical protein
MIGRVAGGIDPRDGETEMRFLFSTSNLLALVAASVLTGQAFAADLTCEITGAVRCLCPASMSVDCGSVSGFVDDKEPVKSVTIAYRTETGESGTLVLTNPKGTARDFYAADYNDEVKAALRKKGIDAEKANVSGKSIVIASTAKIYADPDKKETVSGGSGGGSGVSDCSWVTRPQVIQAKGCGTAFCIGQASCRGAEGTVACKAKADGKNCGTAQACAEDPDVVPVDAENVQIEGSIKGAGTSSGSAH